MSDILFVVTLSVHNLYADGSNNKGNAILRMYAFTFVFDQIRMFNFRLAE